MTYDPIGRNVKIVEQTGGSTTSTKQFVWCSDRRCEERDFGGSLTQKYLEHGRTASGLGYFYSSDHLGSVRELTDGSGNIQAQLTFDQYGRANKIQGGLTSDFQFAGYYFHDRSGFNLAVHRAYSSVWGRWLSRDPVQDIGFLQFPSSLDYTEGQLVANQTGAELESNPYCYVLNMPARLTDPSGLGQNHKQCLDCCICRHRSAVNLCNQLFPTDRNNRFKCLMLAKSLFLLCLSNCFRDPNSCI